jgi:hypothetical protein
MLSEAMPTAFEHVYIPTTFKEALQFPMDSDVLDQIQYFKMLTDEEFQILKNTGKLHFSFRTTRILENSEFTISLPPQPCAFSTRTTFK